MKRGRLKLQGGRWLPSAEEVSQPALIERETQLREGDAYWAGFLAGAGASGFVWTILLCVGILL